MTGWGTALASFGIERVLRNVEYLRRKQAEPRREDPHGVSIRQSGDLEPLR